MKQVLVLGGLLAASLAGAYVSWTAPDVDDPVGDVLVLRATTDELTSVTWKDDDKTVKLTRPTDAAGPWFHVESIERKKSAEPPKTEVATADDAAPADAPAEPSVEEVRTVFAGGPDAEKIWKAFTPFYALRELTSTKPEDVATYGLDKPGISLDLDIGGKVTTVKIGGEAYGTRDRYAQVDGHVYLLDAESLRPLQFATTRLVEHRVHPYEEADITELKVVKGDDSRTFVQQNAADKTHAFWADVGKASERDVEGSAWIGKLLRMRIRSYDVGVDTSALTPIFKFTVTGKDGASWDVAILEGERDGEKAYFARPAWTRSVVELTRSLSQEAIVDLDNLFDGLAPPAEPPPAAAPEAPEPTITPAP